MRKREGLAVHREDNPVAWVVNPDEEDDPPTSYAAPKPDKADRHARIVTLLFDEVFIFLFAGAAFGVFGGLFYPPGIVVTGALALFGFAIVLAAILIWITRRDPGWGGRP